MKPFKYGMLSYGLMNVPVGLATRESKKEVKFKMIHKGCGGSVKLPKVCERDGQKLTLDEIGVGYEVSKGTIIELDKGELEKFAVERENTIKLTKFVPNAEIEKWVEKSYYLLPHDATNSYMLLYNAMRVTGLAGVGSQSLWGRETPCAAYATKDGIIFSVLFCADEINSASELREKLYTETKEDEQKLANVLLSTLSTSLDPAEDLVSVSRSKVDAYIEAKVAGKKVEVLAATDSPAPTVEVLNTLRESIEVAKKTKAKSKKAKVKA